LDQSQVVGELIHADVNGSMSVKSLRGAKSYVFFNDEYNKDCRVFFIKQKKEVSKCLHMCLNEVSTVGHRVKMSQCDDGKEFACEEVPQ